MFKKKDEVTIGINFINTSIENISNDLKNQGNQRDNFVLGLSNDDFYINAIETISGLEEEKKEEIFERELTSLISGYGPMDYINKTIPIKSFTFEETEKTIIISISREKIEKIIEIARGKKIFLTGIYPSFLLDDQESLIDLTNRFDFIPAEEIEEDEVDIYGERKTHLVLLNGGEPFELKEEIFTDSEVPEYNFLGPEYKSKFKRPIMDVNVRRAYFGIFLLAIIGYFTLNILTNNILEELEKIKISSTKIENEIKELESKIALIPTWEAKLKKIEQIMADKKTASNEVLYAIKKSTPEGLYIEKVEIRLKSVLMVGTTDNVDKVFVFERELAKAGFINIRHTTVVNTSGVFKFTIESGLK